MDNTELENAAEQTVETIAEDAAETVDEAIEPASEEAIEPAAEEPQQIDEQQAPRKKSRLPLIIVIVLVVLAAGGFLVYQNLPSTKAGKLVKQAQALSDGKEYAQAIETLISARDIDPENQTVRSAFLDVFEANAQDMLSSVPANYAKALEVYSSAESIMPNDTEALFQKEAEIYKLWAKEEAVSDDIDIVKQQIQKLAEAIERGLPGLGVTKSELEKQLSQLEANKAVNDFAELFSATAANNDIEGMISLFTQNIRNTESELFKKAVSKRGTRASSFPILSDAVSDKKLGIYYRNNEYFIYFGSYDENGKRSGDGIWVTTRGSQDSGTYITYYYNGHWENDKPNGNVYLYHYTRFSTGSEELKTANANVKDGLFDGTFVYSYVAIGDFEVTYVNGDPVQIDTRQDSDGSAIVVYGYNYDHTKMLRNLQMHDGVFGTY